MKVMMRRLGEEVWGRKQVTAQRARRLRISFDVVQVKRKCLIGIENWQSCKSI